MGQKQDLTGMRFGSLVAVEDVGNNKFKSRLWRCRCDCGGEKTSSANNLRRGHCNSCGCQWGMKPIHGGTAGGKVSNLYQRWNNMRSRCNTPTSEHYHRYGGRGIGVCPEWDDFAAFESWALANGYADNLTLDRRDNDGDYTPLNCRWVPRVTQSRNRSVTAWVTVHGERMRLTDAADKNGIDRSTFAKRLARGWTPERAITKPKWTR